MSTTRTLVITLIVWLCDSVASSCVTIMALFGSGAVQFGPRTIAIIAIVGSIAAKIAKSPVLAQLGIEAPRDDANAAWPPARAPQIPGQTLPRSGS